jgi:hypothetical protein
MSVIPLEYSDVQEVQIIQDRMNAAKYILDSNTMICRRAKKELSWNTGIDLLLKELDLQSKRVVNLLERSRSGSMLVR